MIEHFQENNGDRLLQALRSQCLLKGDATIAKELASEIQLKEYAPGSKFIVQGGQDKDLYFLLTGCASIVVNDQAIATYGAGQHVGEMALLDSAAHRSATVVAKDTVVAAAISEQKFTDIANRHPELWRRIAAELAGRLAASRTMPQRVREHA